ASERPAEAGACASTTRRVAAGRIMWSVAGAAAVKAAHATRARPRTQAPRSGLRPDPCRMAFLPATVPGVRTGARPRELQRNPSENPGRFLGRRGHLNAHGHATGDV